MEITQLQLGTMRLEGSIQEIVSIGCLGNVLLDTLVCSGPASASKLLRSIIFKVILHY